MHGLDVLDHPEFVLVVERRPTYAKQITHYLQLKTRHLFRAKNLMRFYRIVATEAVPSSHVFVGIGCCGYGMQLVLASKAAVFRNPEPYFKQAP